LERMLLIRRFEEGMLQLHRRSIMPVHFHISIGQEATAVGVCSSATDEDVIYTNHRSNGHLLARGADPGRMYAEQLGRIGGNTDGKGGTLHMVAPELGIPWTTSLVGCSVPMAVGSALAHKQFGQAGIIIAFFGDGVLEEGAFYEGINLAALWQVPLLCICENNGVPADMRGVDTAKSSTFLARRLTDIPSSFGIKCSTVDGADVKALFGVLRGAADTVRKERRTQFVEVRTSRYPGNRTFWPHLAGAETCLPWAWNEGEPPEAVRDWSMHCDPLMSHVRQLLADGVLSREAILGIDARVRARIEAAMESAIGSPHPSGDLAYCDVFAAKEG